MNAWRIAELHQVLYFVRQARAAMASRDLTKAHRWERLATQGLFMVRGISCRPGSDPTATAGLYRLMLRLSEDMEVALRPPPKVEAWELVEEIADGIRVLRTRDAVDLTDEQATERARNIASRLTSHWEFVAIEPAASDCPQPPHSGEVGAN